MLTSGGDAHKTGPAAGARAGVGRVLAPGRGAHSPAGWPALVAGATTWGTARQWGSEGAGNYGRGLAPHWGEQGETVDAVTARGTAQTRQTARRRGQTERRAAQAVARVVLSQEEPLPPLAADDAAAVRALLTTAREAALAEATRLRNQLHALLLQLDPQDKDHLPALTTAEGLAALESYSVSSSALLLQQQRAAAVRRLAQRLRLALSQAAELAQQIETRARAGFSPLIRLTGGTALPAGAVAGIWGPGQCCRSAAHLAADAAVAPREASAAGSVRQRLNPGGDRRLTAIFSRIALTQARCSPPAKAYLARRQAEGTTKKEAFRALQRSSARRVAPVAGVLCTPASRGSAGCLTAAQTPLFGTPLTEERPGTHGGDCGRRTRHDHKSAAHPPR